MIGQHGGQFHHKVGKAAGPIPVLLGAAQDLPVFGWPDGQGYDGTGSPLLLLFKYDGAAVECGDLSGHPQAQAGVKECTLLKLCCDKALAHLGWKATLNFEETIRFTAEWYHRFYRGEGGKQAGASLLDFSLGQIAAYCNAAEQRQQLWVR